MEVYIVVVVVLRRYAIAYTTPYITQHIGDRMRARYVHRPTDEHVHSVLGFLHVLYSTQYLFK